MRRPRALPLADLHRLPPAGLSGLGCVSPSAQLLMGSELCVLVVACVISPLLEPCLGVRGCSYSLPAAAGGSAAAGELQRALKASLPYQP